MDGIMDGVLYERRRADRAEEQLAALREENARLRAEVARLRAALHDIEDTPCLPSEPTALLLRKMARAALAPEVKP